MRGSVALALLLGLMATPAPATANPTANPQLALEQGRVAYERGNYGEAVQAIQPLLYPSIELRNEEAVVEAHRLLSMAYLFLAKTAEAEQEASSLLALRPDYEPDPVIDPPAAVTFFQVIKKKQNDRLIEIRERQRLDAERALREEEKRRVQEHAKAERVFLQKVVEKHYRIIGFLPFGAGQFQNHQTGYGIGFATVEATLAAAWIALTVEINYRYQGGLVPKGQHTTAAIMSGFQLGTAAAFWAVTAWGIIDAQVKFKPEQLIDTRDVPVEKPKPKITFAPIVSPGLYGLGVQGAW